MVRSATLRVFRLPRRRPPPALPESLRKARPRDFVEWKTLRQWGKLPSWEPASAGYLLRAAREEAGLTQQELASRLDCSQQAIAQAERWDSNPTVSYMRRWAVGCECRLEVEFPPGS